MKGNCEEPTKPVWCKMSINSYQDIILKAFSRFSLWEYCHYSKHIYKILEQALTQAGFLSSKSVHLFIGSHLKVVKLALMTNVVQST